ncbi:hypothetical protein RCL1_003516 [Eukaryota sp. TZLM3-RCL]
MKTMILLDNVVLMLSFHPPMVDVVDVVTVDVCKYTADKFCFSETSPLDNAEQGKRLKYEKPLSKVESVLHVKYELCPFAVSLFGNLGKSVLNFLQDFKLVSGRHNTHFDSSFWTNRLEFTIIKMVRLVISRSLEAVSVILESKAAVRLDESDVCFDDIDFSLVSSI